MIAVVVAVVAVGRTRLLLEEETTCSANRGTGSTVTSMITRIEMVQEHDVR